MVVLVVSTTTATMILLLVTAHAARHCHANVVRYAESVEQNDYHHHHHYHHWRMLISIQLATVVPVLGHQP